MNVILLSFAVIFVAELGDKSQLMALTFATRYRTVPILIGITIATAVVHAVSVLLGVVLSVSLPTNALNVAAGIAFLGFAAWTLRGDTLSEDEAAKAERMSNRSAIAAGETTEEAIAQEGCGYAQHQADHRRRLPIRRGAGRVPGAQARGAFRQDRDRCLVRRSRRGN